MVNLTMLRIGSSIHSGVFFLGMEAMGQDSSQEFATKISYLNGKASTIHLRKCQIVSVNSEGKRVEWTFEKGKVCVGSMEDNDVVLANETVSRYHAEIIEDNESYIIRDLGSTNGTWVNQVRVKEAYLPSGSLLKFGDAECIFQPLDEEIPIVPSSEEKFGDIIGGDIKMREIYGILEKISPTNATVVIEGETGTGKEVIAHTIHKMSLRSKKPFVVFDCGAVPESLIESELFGHEKGSFTGAIMTRQGLFELAQGGTIFLDELGELSVELQPKLLRVLEQREVRRVGAAKTIAVDVRVIAATNRDLESEVRNGRFREDLFYRLSVVRIFIPPLRDRIGDMALLVKHFLKHSSFNRDRHSNLKLRSISREAMNAMRNYEWPGNVRELLNVVERACSLSDSDCIELNDLPKHIACRSSLYEENAHVSLAEEVVSGVSPKVMGIEVPDTEDLIARSFKEAKEIWLASFEKEYLVSLLERNENNISRAAKEAELDRKYFRKLMKKHDLIADEEESS